MSYLQRFAAHNTPAAQKYMLQLMEENRRLRNMLQTEENNPPQPEITSIPAFDFEQFCTETRINVKPS